MKRIALLSAAALVGAGALAGPPAQARDGGALAAGLVGGLAAGVLIGAATQAHAVPAHYAGDAYDDADGPRAYPRPAPAYRAYDDGRDYAPRPYAPQAYERPAYARPAYARPAYGRPVYEAGRPVAYGSGGGYGPPRGFRDGGFRDDGFCERDRGYGRSWDDDRGRHGW